MIGAEILLVGCGNMGGAMLRGWIGQGRAASVTVVDPVPERAPPGIRALPSLEALPARPQVVVLAVKPQKLAAVAPTLAPHVGPDTILLSVLAAVESGTLRRHFPHAGGIVRAVPNLPASIGAGATALVAPGLGEKERALVTELCRPLGAVEWLESEAQIDAATSVSGCGPAFLFRFADAVVQAGVSQGLDEGQARRLFAQTMIGAGRMLAEGDLSPGEMARRVASPGGGTLAGLAVLDHEDALRRLIAETLAAAAARNAEMAAEARDG
jgi:pyrroline-5-carboxylate reductase